MSITTTEERRPLTLPLLPRTSVGCKMAVAITGLALTGFVLIHMLGNLQVYLGRETLNAYAHFLKSVPELLWGARLGLLTLFVYHIVVAVRLRIHTFETRSTPYVLNRSVATTTASKYMLLSGLVVLAFVLYHLAHFTLGWTQMTPDGKSVLTLVDPKSGYQDVYEMVILGFRNPVVSGLYIIANILLAMHLYHGVGSLFQTLGLHRSWVKPLGRAVAIVVLIGNVSIPLTILTGLVGSS